MRCEVVLRLNRLFIVCDRWLGLVRLCSVLCLVRVIMFYLSVVKLVVGVVVMVFMCWLVLVMGVVNVLLRLR